LVFVKQVWGAYETDNVNSRWNRISEFGLDKTLKM